MLAGNKIRFCFYAIVGLAYFLLWEISNLSSYEDFLIARIVNEIWRTVYIIFVNYFFFEVVLPGLSLKKIFSSILLILVQIFLYSFGLFFWRGIGIILHIYTEIKTYPSLIDGVAIHFPYSIGSVVFFLVIRHYYNHIKLRQYSQQLQIEKQKAELNYLKSQTNPHFLFNTLNNIYALSRDKSDLAPESILRLSKILRYMLYETGNEEIPLETELKIISDYIDLEKLRYDNSLRLNFDYKISDNTIKIPPLLLLPLIENAFKHGVSESVDDPFIDIHITADHNRLILIVKNSSVKDPNEASLKENIGLSNLRRQLQLLYSDHELKVEQTDSVFTVSLFINTKSHV